ATIAPDRTKRRPTALDAIVARRRAGRYRPAGTDTAPPPALPAPVPRAAAGTAGFRATPGRRLSAPDAAGARPRCPACTDRSSRHQPFIGRQRLRRNVVDHHPARLEHQHAVEVPQQLEIVGDDDGVLLQSGDGAGDTPLVA